MLTADGAHWRWQRQSAAPIFRHERLLAFLPAMLQGRRRNARSLVGTCHRARHIDIGHEMMRTTFDIIVETMLSGRANIDVAQNRTARSPTILRRPAGFLRSACLNLPPHGCRIPGRRVADWPPSRYLRSAILRSTILTAARASQGPGKSGDLIDLLLSIGRSRRPAGR